MEVVRLQALQTSSLLIDLQKTFFDLLFNIINKSMSSFPSNIQKLLEILQEFLNIRASMNLLLILNHLSFNLLQLSSYIISSTYRLRKRTRHMTLIRILIYQLDTLHLAKFIKHLPSTFSGDNNVIVSHLITAEETHDFSLDFF